MWTHNSEQVIIRLDANSDVRLGPLALMLQSLGFQEQITFRHGHYQKPPATHRDNTKGIPIDGIWTNFAHGEMRCGYLGHDGQALPGDHRTAWIDIPKAIMFGYCPPDIH